MFQDIDPYEITYDPGRTGPEEGDHVVFMKDGLVLLEVNGSSLAVPTYGEVKQDLGGNADGLVYLFSVDGAAWYYSPERPEAVARFVYTNIRTVRFLEPPFLAFVSATAYHFALWYENNRYCGKCSGPMRSKEDERALHCPTCGLVKYPKINPAIIVGVTDGDRLLLARNARGEYRKYCLIAGFVEPGETLEAAMAREVMEETGLRIANPRYHKSQPWAFSQSILMGFFADLQGDPTVNLDSGELSEVRWFHRSEIPAEDTSFSLTWDMIETFRDGGA